jgi:hypothetical protein
MKDLVRLLREKRQRIDLLRRELAAFEEKKRELTKLEAELREAAAILRGDNQIAMLDRPKSRHGFVGGRRAKPIQQGSSIWWTAKVLYMTSQPMHIDKILERIEKESGVAFKKATVVSNLSRYVRYADTFERPAPNVYALKDFSRDVEGNERGAA